MLNISWVLRMRCCSCPRSQGSFRGEVGLELSPAPRLGRFPTGPFQSSLPAAPPDSPSVTSWLSPMEPPAHPCSPRSACAMLPSRLEAGLQGQRPRPATLQLRGLRRPHQSRPWSARFIPPQCSQEEGLSEGPENCGLCGRCRSLRRASFLQASAPVHTEASCLTGSESISRSAFQWPLLASYAFALFLLSNHTVFAKQIRLLASASFRH